MMSWKSKIFNLGFSQSYAVGAVIAWSKNWVSKDFQQDRSAWVQRNHELEVGNRHRTVSCISFKETSTSAGSLPCRPLSFQSSSFRLWLAVRTWGQSTHIWSHVWFSTKETLIFQKEAQVLVAWKQIILFCPCKWCRTKKLISNW